MLAGPPQSTIDAIIQNAILTGIDPTLAMEVALAESGANQNAVSSTGAIGIYQIEPATAAGLGIDPTDPAQNIQGGQAYLQQMLSQFGGDYQAALAAYNWGPGNVTRAQATYGANWFSYAPASVQSYVNGIIGNVNTAYTVSGSPSDDGSTSTTSPDGDNSSLTNNVLLYTLAGVIVLIVILS
jgi:soluble lytic murein transglycosylase-like protein